MSPTLRRSTPAAAARPAPSRAPVHNDPGLAGARLPRRHAAGLLRAHAAEPAARAQRSGRRRCAAPAGAAAHRARSDDPTIALARRRGLRRRRAHLLPGAHRQRRLPAHRDRAALGPRAGARDRLRAEARASRRACISPSRSRTRPGAPGVCTLAAGHAGAERAAAGQAAAGVRDERRARGARRMERAAAAADTAGRHGGARRAGQRRRAARKALVLLGPSGSFPAGTDGAASRTTEPSSCSASIPTSRSTRRSMRSRSAASIFTEAASGIAAATCCCSSARRATSRDNAGAAR